MTLNASSVTSVKTHLPLTEQREGKLWDIIQAEGIRWLYDSEMVNTVCLCFLNSSLYLVSGDKKLWQDVNVEQSYRDMTAYIVHQRRYGYVPHVREIIQ